MARTKQDTKDKWERKRVQRVLDYHNKKYRVHIKIKGKTTDVYPNLKGRLNWDWVCSDAQTGDEVAVEVKRLTDPKLEERWNIMWQLLEEVRDNISNELPGSFLLHFNIPRKYYLQLRGQLNRQEFKNILCKVIYETAQRLQLGEEKGLTPQIIEQLPFSLSDCFFSLYKYRDEGSALGLGSGVTGFWSTRLSEHELKRFEQLVSDANKQLNVAKKKFNVKDTFLVFIDEGLRLANPYTVADAIKRINHDSYSQINYIYYVSGEKVEEIPLPTPSWKPSCLLLPEQQDRHQRKRGLVGCKPATASQQSGWRAGG